MRQYIGARYVTKIYENSQDPSSAEWESGVTYEPLMIVTYLNSSYMSKMTVPGSVGNPAANPDYWTQTGFYNGQIAALDSRLTAAEGDITSLENEVFYRKDHVVIIGDSWADEPHDSDVQLNHTLRDRLKCTVHNYAYGGTGFDVPNGYDQQITWMQDDLNNDVFSLDHVKCIILMCGLNDHYGGATYSAFAARLQDWYDKLMTAITGYNNIPVYWFQNYSIENDVNVTNKTTLFQQMAYYGNVIANIEADIRYVPMFGFCDGVEWKNDRHPNARGHQQVANNVVNIINGEPPKLYRYQRISGTIDNSGLSTSDATVYLDYYVTFGGAVCRSYLNVAGTALHGISTYNTVTYDHTPPTELTACIIPQDVLLADSSYTSFILYASGSSTYTRASGRYTYEVTNPLNTQYTP